MAIAPPSFTSMWGLDRELDDGERVEAVGYIGKSHNDEFRPVVFWVDGQPVNQVLDEELPPRTTAPGPLPAGRPALLRLRPGRAVSIRGLRGRHVTGGGVGDPIAPAEAMMRALWEGQTSRHGAQTATVPESLEAARAGVHLAAALVQWFVSGAVARTP
ncbi:hypothetical protein [Streptomyces californicus]|uniref:hypothetical protein n=1 Tax=Streptomyces californicus TaxID=67351 RepID=UPI0033F1F04D